jgi:hypothetical protein
MVQMHTCRCRRWAEADGRKAASRRAERVNQRLFRRCSRVSLVGLVSLVSLVWPLCQTGFV